MKTPKTVKLLDNYGQLWRVLEVNDLPESLWLRDADTHDFALKICLHQQFLMIHDGNWKALKQYHQSLTGCSV